MIKIPKRTFDRIKDGLKKYDKIALSLKERDVSEADTVTVVKDMLADVFGYDKYVELTGEYQIRGTFCDLAEKIDNKIKYLIEVKAAGTDLNDGHLRQAVNYGAKEGIEWIVLTNSISWHLHRIKFAQPIDHEEVASFSILDIDFRKSDDQEKVFLLSREAITDGAMDVYHKHSQQFNRYTIAQLLKSDSVLSVVRRELRKVFANMKVDKEDIKLMIEEEILKRDVVNSEKATEAERKIRKELKKLAKKKATRKKKEAPKADSAPSTPSVDNAPGGSDNSES